LNYIPFPTFPPIEFGVAPHEIPFAFLRSIFLYNRSFACLPSLFVDSVLGFSRGLFGFFFFLASRLATVFTVPLAAWGVLHYLFLIPLQISIGWLFFRALVSFLFVPPFCFPVLPMPAQCGFRPPLLPSGPQIGLRLSPDSHPC